MGRGLLEVRVCACPGRDSNLEDKQQKQPFRRKRRLPDETTGIYITITAVTCRSTLLYFDA